MWTVGALSNGGSATIDIAATVATLGAKTNTAQVSAADQFDGDSTPANDDPTEDDQASAVVTPQQIDLSLIKTVDDATPSVGQTIAYTVTLTNGGPDTATGIAVTDVVPGQLGTVVVTPSAGTWTAPTWSVPSLASGASATLQISGTVDGTGDLTNTAEVTAADQTDPDSTPDNDDPTEDDQASAVVTVPATIDLSLTKTVDDATPAFQDTVTFTVTLTNDGPDPATAIEVTDVVPSGLADVVVTPATGTWTAPVWAVPSLGVGASTALVVTGRVDSTAVQTNTAEVTAAAEQDIDSTPGNDDPAEDDQASAQVDAPDTVDLELTKTVDDATPGQGDLVTFTVVLSNVGPDTATGVTVTDALPAGLVYDSSTASGTGSYDELTDVWTVADPVAAGGMATLTLTAVVDGFGTLTNTAEVTTQDQVDVDSTPGNGVAAEDDQDSAAVTPPESDLSLTKSVDDPTPDVGDTVTFTVTVSNAGPDGATGVLVTDALPSGVTHVSDDSGGAYDPVAGTWTIGALPSGGSTSLAITASVDASGTITNVAQVAAADQDDPDSTPGNNAPAEDDQDTATLTVTPAADLSLTKTVDDATPNVGDTVTFTVTLTNDGPDTGTGIEVTDTLSAGLSFVGAATATGSYDDTTDVWSVPSLANGASATLTVTATVDATGAESNTAEITAADQFDQDSTPGNGLVGEDDLATAPLNAQVADLSVTKVVDDAAPNTGDTVTFTVTVSNAGPDAATNVAVRDALPVGLVFAGATADQGSYDEGTGIWTVGTLADGGSASIDISAVVTSETTVRNVAEVAASDQADPDSQPGDGPVGDDDDAAVDVTPQLADLQLTKTVDTAAPALGDQVTFTVTLFNDGPDTATGVTVFDTLPTSTTFVSSTPSVGSYDAVGGVWTLPPLPASSVETLTLVATVDETGVTTNTAQVGTADQADPTSEPGNDDAGEDDQDSATVTVAPTVDLAVTKTVDDATPALGATVAFTVTVRNDGPDDATGVVVTDQLPTGLTFVGATPSVGAYDDTTGAWTVGALAAGATATLTLQATVDATGPIDNVAEVTAQDQVDRDSAPSNGDPAEDDQDLATVTAPRTIDLSLTKTVDQPTATVGDTVVFTVALTNDGPDAGTGVTVSDPLPAGLGFVTTTRTTGTYDDTSGTWTVGTIAAGTTETLTITATVDAPGTLVNTAQVATANELDPDSTPGNSVPGEDDQDSASISSEQVDLSLTKTVDDATPNVGDTITFTLTVANAGPDDATSVSVSDTLPAGLTFVTSTPSAGSYDAATGLWTIGTVADGGTATLDITVTVTGSADVTNTAQVAAADQNDVDSTPANDDAGEDDQDSVDVAPQRIDLEVTKTVDQPTVALGDTVTFTVTVTNAVTSLSGGDTATGVALTDVVPASLSGVSVTPSQGTYVGDVWTVGALAADGGSATLTVTGTVTSSGDTTNTAEVTAADQFDVDSTPANGNAGEDDQDSATVTVPATVDLRVDKTVDDPTPAAGDTVTFTVTLTNDGPDDATGVTVADALPTGLTFVTATPGQGTYDAAAGTWTVGDLTAGASVTLDLTVTADQAGTITNTASVATVDQVDDDPSNDSDAATVVVAADGTIGDTVFRDLDGNGTQDLGEPGLGGVDLVLTSPGPDGVLGTADDTTATTTTTSTGTYSFTGLTAGDHEVDVVDATVPDDLFLTAGSDPTVVTLRSDSDIDLTADIGYQPRVDLVVTKTVAPSPVDVGAAATFTVGVTNDSTVDATGVRLVDVVPAGLMLGTVTVSQGTYDAGSGTWDVGGLAAGAAATLDLEVVPTAAASYDNTAALAVVDQPDQDPTNDSATATLVAEASGELGDTVFLARDGDGTQDPGDDGIAGVTVTLLGPGPDDTLGTPDDEVLATDVTDGTGTYGFTGLTAGTYRVDVDDATLPPDLQLSTANDPEDVVLATDDASDLSVDVGYAPLVDLALTKSVDNDRPDVGATVVFTVAVSNTSANDATGVVVTDQLPAGFSYVSDDASGAYDAPSGAWTVGDLASGATATLAITAIVDDAAADINVAEVTAADQTDVDSTPGNGIAGEDDQDNAPINPVVADLAVTKGVDDATPEVGDVVTFTVTLTNEGPDDATGVAVSDVLPAGLALRTATATQGTYDGTSGVWTVGALPNGDTVTLTLTVDVTGSGVLTNTAAVAASDQFDDDPSDDSDDASVDVPAPSSIGDTVFDDLDGDGVLDAGELGLSGVIVRLLGPGPDATLGTADDVLLQTDTTDGAGAYLFAPLSAGQYRVAVDATTVPTGYVLTTANDPTDVTLAVGEDRLNVDLGYQVQADLSLTKQVSDSTPGVGDTVTYTLTLVNDGPATATDVEVADVLPTGVTFATSSASQGAYDDATTTWAVGDVIAGGTATLTLLADVTGTGVITNTAEVVSVDQADPDSTPGNGDAAEDDQDDATITVPGSADLSLTKTVDEDRPGAGATVVWTVTVRNAGPDDATNVTVSDDLPTGVTYLSDTPSQGAFDPGTGVWTVGTLASGASAQLQVSTTVDVATPQTNVAQVATSDQDDPDSTPGNDSQGEDDQDQASINPLTADLGITKSVDDPTPNVGDTVTFTVDLTNDGPDDAETVAALDDLLTGLTYLSHTATDGVFNPSNGVWDVDALANGAGATLTIDARVDTANPISNTAEIVTSNSFDPNPDNDTSTVGVTPQRADLRLTKSVAPLTVAAGDTATFTITLTNDGPRDATNVEVADTFPAGLTLDTATPTQGTFSGGVWDVGTLPAGASTTLTLDVTADAAGSRRNVAQVSAADQFDPDSVPANNVATEDDHDDAVLTVVPAGVIGDTVFVDLDGNGVQDPGEGGIGGVVLRLTAAGPDGILGTADDVVTTTTTAGDGTYAFTGRRAGTYEVSVDAATVPMGLVLTTANDPTTVTLASDADQDLTVDLGYRPVADLRVTKVVDVATPDIGDIVTFTVTVTNDGPAGATGVVVGDTLPAGLTYVGDDAGGDYDPGTGAWTVGTLANGASATLSLQASADQGGNRTNVAEVIASDQFDPDSTPGNGDPAEDDRDTATVVPVAAGTIGDLVFADTDGDGTPDPGEDGIAGIDLELYEAGPDGVVATADDVLVATTTTAADGSYLFTDLAGGDYLVGVVTSTVPAGAIRTSGPATATLPDAASSDLDADIGYQLAIDVDADIAVDDTTPAIGQTVTFTVTVGNDGPGDATGVDATVALPSGVTYVGDTSGGAFDPTTGAWTIGALEAGTTVTFDITATVDAPGVRTATIEVVAHDQLDTDSVPANDVLAEDDQDEVQLDVVAQPGIDLTLTGDETVLAGTTVVLPHVLTNTGDAVDDILVTATNDLGWPIALYVDADGDGVLDATDPQVVGALSLAPDESVDLLIEITAPAGTPAGTSSTTTTTATSGIDPTETVSTTDRVTVVAPVLTIDKQVSPTGTAAPGDRLVYTIVVTNSGSAPATNPLVIDDTPAGTTYEPGSTTLDGAAVADSATGDGNPLASAAGGLALPDLAAGTSATITLAVTVDDDATGQVRNVAVASSDETPEAVSSRAELPVAPPLDPGDLDVLKRATADDVVQPGTVIRWFIEVTNTGGSTLEAVVLGDDLPELTNYVPGTTEIDGAAVPDDGTLPLADGVEIGPIEPGQTIVASFDTEVLDAPDDALIENTAVVSSVGLSTSVPSNQVTVSIGQDLPDTGAGSASTVLTVATALVALGLALLGVARRRDDEDLRPA